MSRDKTSDRRSVPHPGSPAFHGGTPPAPLLCTGREGAGSPQGPLLGLTQRALKSQPVTLAPILTAELGPASPKRKRSCNRTRSGHGATSRRKLPPATHTMTHVAPTEAPLGWEFALSHFLGWDRRTQELQSQNLLHRQQPHSSLYPFPSYLHTKKPLNLLEITIKGKGMTWPCGKLPPSQFHPPWPGDSGAVARNWGWGSRMGVPRGAGTHGEGSGRC